MIQPGNWPSNWGGEMTYNPRPCPNCGRSAADTDNAVKAVKVLQRENEVLRFALANLEREARAMWEDFGDGGYWEACEAAKSALGD